ncbi:MAG TPA: hypothetical protein DCZ73_04755 [Bacteroides sp.]|nr:hypothetical protein [Bacteroides sp.]
MVTKIQIFREVWLIEKGKSKQNRRNEDMKQAYKRPVLKHCQQKRQLRTGFPDGQKRIKTRHKG